MKRTDIHRPSAINVDEYQFVAFEYIKIGSGGDILADCAFLQGERETIRRHMAATKGTYANHEHGGNCHICGASAIYTVLFYHSLSNTYIRTGQDCAEKLQFAMGGNYDMFRSSVKDALTLRAGKRKAEAVLIEAGIAGAWAIYTAEQPKDENGHFMRLPYEETTIIDIVGKLVQYGSISERATSFLASLVDKVNRRAEILAAREAAHDAALDLPVPTGRIAVAGTVLSIKVDDGRFGPTTKMLVQHASGWKVWGTRPASLIGVKKGDSVRFMAAIQPSKNDTKFGFFSRPTQAEITSSEESEEVAVAA